MKQVVPKDAIPSVDDPAFVEEYPGDTDDRVAVFEGERTARAYPVRYLDYHEVVNDVVDGQPIAVTWCPLCGSAVVYARTVDGRTLSFGVSGKLDDDNLVMYDRETGTLWKQARGDAVEGPLAGAALDVLPAAMMPHERFAADHPEGEVLARPGGESEAAGDGHDREPIDYDQDPYREYVEGEGFGLAAHHGEAGREWNRDDVGPKAVVLGIERDGAALAFPEQAVRAAGGVVHETVGDADLAVFATRDGLHAFEAGDRSFEPTDDPGRFAADGALWAGATGRSDDGHRLSRVPAKRLFAFAWQDDHGPDAFWQP
ncbi:MAG: DUF3179 domain-containing protein [Halobacteriales archaeon]